MQSASPGPATSEEDAVSLTNVWVQTHADGLVRADQVIGIEAHITAGLRGVPSHWLLDVVLTTSVGSGAREGWKVTALHRTLAQTVFPPKGASLALARLLAQLDGISAVGVVSVEKEDSDATAGPTPEGPITSAGGIRFRFVPFPPPAPPSRRDDIEYL
jgi:hypothetical protein